jgi:hypothetical protein
VLPCLPFCCVTPAELFSPAIDDSRVHGQLVADDRLAIRAPCQLDTPNLWRELTALSHDLTRRTHGCYHDAASVCSAMKRLISAVLTRREAQTRTQRSSPASNSR